MIPSVASMSASSSSSSSATVRVEKATSDFLIGPDWTLNMDICDTINSNQMLAKDVVKAVKKRLQHKSPKVQLLALTLLEAMVKNCGDYVHFQIAERNILQEMVKIVKKKTDMHVRDKVLTLIGSWHEAFGGPGGKCPQYYMAYEELRRSGVQFPRRSPDAAPIFTPPVAHPVSRPPQIGHGMPSSSSSRLDEAMAAEDNLSLSGITSMRNVFDLLTDMLRAVDPSDRSAVKDEVIIDLVEQCRVNQRKLMQLLGTTGDEELLGQGLELNDNLQTVIAKHDAIASGSPLPPEVMNITHGVSEKHDSGWESAEVSKPSAASNCTPSAPDFPSPRGVIDEEDDEEDDFAQLARRHSKPQTDASPNTSMAKSDETQSEPPSSPTMSNALVPVDVPSSVRSKDQDIIDLLSLTLSTTGPSSEQASQTFTSTTDTSGHIPSSTPGITFSSEAYPGNNGLAFNSYIAPWAQPQTQQPLPSQSEHPPDPRFQPQLQPQPYSQSQPQPLYNSQLASQPQNISPSQIQSQLELQPQLEQQARYQPQHQYATQQAYRPPNPQPQFTQYTYSYPPPPWAATPGYFSNPNPVSRPTYTYSTPRPASSLNTRVVNGEALVNNSSPRSAPPTTGQKPFIPSYRLFEDLDVFGNNDGRFKSTSNASPSLSNSQSMVGGRK